MATRRAVNIATMKEEEIEIEQERRDGGFWPPCYLNFWHHHRRIAPDAPAFMLDRQPNDFLGFHDGERGGRITVFGKPHIYSQSTLFHELWHHAESRLASRAECEIVYREVRRGDDWGSDYLDSDSERAARAFEHYASARAHGLQMAAAKKGSAQAVFQKIYEGRAHAECEKRRRRERLRPLLEWGWMLAGAGGLFGVFFVILPHLLTH
ncbi:hypothetical protein AAC691_17370 [Nguyenibacter vanlangensis]|uniref:Uncharacterized protein n=1 Tax=Nguyenibacter vanlangensis TaxID=1216886 RepID=A0ABZ3D2N5_9PROT